MLMRKCPSVTTQKAISWLNVHDATNCEYCMFPSFGVFIADLNGYHSTQNHEFYFVYSGQFHVCQWESFRGRSRQTFFYNFCSTSTRLQQSLIGCIDAERAEINTCQCNDFEVSHWMKELMVLCQIKCSQCEANRVKTETVLVNIKATWVSNYK